MNEPDLFLNNNESSACFDKEYYDSAVFEKLSFPGLKLKRIEFSQCMFKNINFAQSEFVNCRFEDCRFIMCDMSLVKLKDSLILNTIFEDSKLIGINWTETLKPIKTGFLRCKINDSNFWDTDVRFINIKECEARNVIFSGANLTKADFDGTDLSGSRFQKTNLANADLSGAMNYNINPNDNCIKHAKFSYPEVLTLLSDFNIIIE